MDGQLVGAGAVTRQLAELLTDCPDCHVEGALVEQVGAIHVATCRMCGYRLEAGEVMARGRRFRTKEDVVDALTAWSTAEGHADVESFLRLNFLDATRTQVIDRILDGQPVGTSFDVLAWLLPGFGAGAASLGVSPQSGVPPQAVEPPLPPPPPDDPRAEALALLSVAMADGVITPAEARLLSAVDAEARVYRPTEMGRPPDPAAVVEKMVRLAWADGEVDASEQRVIVEFARAWSVPIDLRRLPLGRPWQRNLRRLVRGVVG